MNISLIVIISIISVTVFGITVCLCKEENKIKRMQKTEYGTYTYP